MDPGSLALLIPIVAIAAVAAVKIARILSGPRSGDSADTISRINALEDDVGQLRQALNETQERLDFAERLLAQSRQDRLGPSEQP